MTGECCDGDCHGWKSEADIAVVGTASEDNTEMGESCGVVEPVMENAWNAVEL